MLDTTAIADELGRLKAERDAIDARVAELKGRLQRAGIAFGVGEDYQFTFIHQERRCTDWRTVAERLRPSYQLIVAHTTIKGIDSLRVDPV